jgi:MFS transporter, MHS family, proline/betaine transporter
MTVDGHDFEADAEAVKRHRALFRAIKRRRNPPLRRTDITVTDEAAVRRAVKAAALGNAMEWFDFGLYSYLAVTIGHVFFVRHLRGVLSGAADRRNGVRSDG